MNRIIQIVLVISTTIGLNGCTSFGRGIAEVYFEQQDAADTRVCEITGESFAGLKPHLDRRTGKMKVLMVHGVGFHLPGYSTQFIEKLAKEMGLTVKSKKNKDIALKDPLNEETDLGNLRIHRLLNKNRSKELLFYELTWSKITAPEKAVLAYDNSGEYSFRRAEVNDLLKKFSNDTGPDPIIYLGEKRETILKAFTQSFCWMVSHEWQDLPGNESQACLLDDPKAVDNLHNDQYAFISHSLGSRITIDGLQKVADLFDEPEFKTKEPFTQALAALLQEKEISIYMMSNQLPMLQLGRKLPEVNDQNEEYCSPNGAKYSDRMLSKTSIIAFSDPNDLLSYAVPQGFVEKYLDSRLCIDVTNININVAKIFDAFGLGRLASPLDAHIGYDTDDRVVALIAKGIGNDYTSDIVQERCNWIETID